MLGKRETPFRILYAFNRKDKEFMDKLFILNYVKVLWTGCLRKGMEEVQKEERKENRGNGSFIQRDVYVQYCGITPKWKDIRIADIIQYQIGVIYAVMRIYRSHVQCSIMRIVKNECK